MMRRAVLSDLDALLAIESRAFTGDRLSPRAMRSMISNPRAQMIVAEDADGGGGLAGYGLLLYRRNCGFARLYSLAVDPAAQGLGIARKLLQNLSEQCGAPVISLEVRADNARAIALYTSLGFDEIARRHHYYDDGADALVMRKAV